MTISRWELLQLFCSFTPAERCSSLILCVLLFAGTDTEVENERQQNPGLI